jgi:predicted XRE-type DNA-binding protein
MMRKTPAAKDPMRNVWLQLGFPDAEEHYLKAELVLRLHRTITSLGLTQRAAARRIGATQPELSKILRGKFTEVSLERLMRFLTALGCQIEIKIRAGHRGRQRAPFAGSSLGSMMSTSSRISTNFSMSCPKATNAFHGASSKSSGAAGRPGCRKSL